MGSTIRIALRNLDRSRRRTLLALAAIALSQMGVLAMNGFTNGRASWTLDAVTGPLMGHVQIHAESYRDEQASDLVIDDLAARLAAVRSAEGVTAAYARIYGPALAAHEIDGYPAMVVGIDPDAESGLGGLIEGLEESAWPRDHDVLVGRSFARQNGIEVGDEIAIVGQAADGSMANDLLTVRGILVSPVELVETSGIVVSLEMAQEIFVMPDMAHEITVRGPVGRADDAPRIASRLTALPELSGLEVLPWRELAPEMAASVDQAAALGLVIVVIVFIAAAAGVSNTMLMATYERRRELGMLLALGTSPGRLIRMILTEAMALGVLGVLAGSLIGGLLVFWMGSAGVSMAPGANTDNVSAYGVTFNGVLRPFLDFGDYLPGVIGVSVVSVLSAVWPALVTARMEPVEAMRS